MTSDPYQAYPSFPAGAPTRLAEEPAVQLVAVGPYKQRRLTVAFRLILIIPHAFVLFFLNLAGFVVSFLGWWGALFTGRLPGFAVTYLSGLARWNTRFYGYLFLLTDDYPPFNFDDDPAYPVVLAIPEAGRLNPLAVFFRFILVTWAYIVATLVIGGASTIVAFIAWLITLITGKLPAPLHLAFTAVLRYWTRYFCYTNLLTSTYPWKLFGDAPDASAPVTRAPAETGTPAESAWGAPPADWASPAYGTPPAYGAPPAYGTPPAYGAPPAYGTPPTYGTAPGYETTVGYGTPASGYGAPSEYGSSEPAAPPADWRLVLPQSAKTLLIVFIVLGLANVGLQIARLAGAHKAANSLAVKTVAISQWNSAFTTLKTDMAQDPTSKCGQSLSCYTTDDSHFAAALSTFATQVQAITMPPAAAADANTVVADAKQAAQDFTQLSHVTDVGLYNSTYSGLGVATELQRFQQDLATFATTLSNS